MAVTTTVLVPAKLVEAVQTTQYTAANVTAIIDKFTATNVSAAPATISVNIVTTLGAAGNDNLITKTKTLQPSEVYTFPELVGQVLTAGCFISTIAGTASALRRAACVASNGCVATVATSLSSSLQKRMIFDLTI